MGELNHTTTTQEANHTANNVGSPAGPPPPYTPNDDQYRSPPFNPFYHSDSSNDNTRVSNSFNTTNESLQDGK